MEKVSSKKFMTDTKLFWFFTGGLSAIALLILWSSFKGAYKENKKKTEDPTYSKIKDLMTEADELLAILKHM